MVTDTDCCLRRDRDAANRLFSCCFIPFSHPKLASDTMEFLNTREWKLSNQFNIVPCHNTKALCVYESILVGADYLCVFTVQALLPFKGCKGRSRRGGQVSV